MQNDGDITTQAVTRAVAAAERWQEAEGRARQCLLDWVTVVIASRSAQHDAIVVGEELATGGAPSVATGSRHPVAEAALLDAMHAHLLDFDDYHLDVPGHASVAVVAAALAETRSAGGDLGTALRAIVAGVEVVTALGRAVGDRLFELGYHPTAVLGAMGAATAASFVHGIDADRVRTAIGLAALQASGTMAGFGNVGKPWQVGCAARDGVHAAAAARSQSVVLSDLLGSRHGALTLMAGPASVTVLDDAPALGRTQFKQYATCFGTHAAIDATRRLMTAGTAAADVAAIDVRVGGDFEHVVINPAPTTLLGAKFSVSSVVALAVLGRPPMTPDFFDETTLGDAEYQRLERATSAVGDPSIAGGGASVRITLHDGSVLEHDEAEAQVVPVDEAWAAVEEKAVAITASSLTADGAIDLATTIRDSRPDTPLETVLAPLSRPQQTATNGAEL